MTTESEKIETILEKMVEATNSLCTAYDSVREELDKVAAEEKKNSEFFLALKL